MAVDIIGALYDPPAVPGGDPVRLWGFRVNITPDELEARPDLASRVITPSRLRRVWAGDSATSPTLTVALRFNGETAAREALGDLWPAALA